MSRLWVVKAVLFSTEDIVLLFRLSRQVKQLMQYLAAFPDYYDS